MADQTTPASSETIEALSDTLYDALYAITPFAERYFADEREGLRDAVRAVLKQAAVPPATTNHDTVAALGSVSPHTLAFIANHLDARAVATIQAGSQTYADWQTVAAELRRVADELAVTETQARRGDAFEAWLKAQRDACFGHASSWAAVDGLLDQYRLHADTGTPLGEHVCEGQAAGDCECLEQPAAGARQDGAQR